MAPETRRSSVVTSTGWWSTVSRQIVVPGLLIHIVRTCSFTSKAPNTTKNAPITTLTNSTCIAWLTNMTRPTLNRCAWRSGTPPMSVSRSRARTAAGSWTGEEQHAEREEQDRRGHDERGGRGREHLPQL